MSYYIAKTVSGPFNAVVADVIARLKAQGFGVLTDIDVQATLKKKINTDFRPYRILGACNPQMAYQALQAEDKIGTMLPCNVVVQEIAPGRSEVAAIDPVASMQAIDNAELRTLAGEVRDRLRRVIERL